MASSRAEELVRGIGRAYEAALVELEGTDLDSVHGRLNEVDQLTQELQALQERQELEGADADPVDPKWTLRVQELHSQLCSVIGAARSRIGTQLRQAGEGRRALRGYGGKATTTGTYHRSEG